MWIQLLKIEITNLYCLNDFIQFLLHLNLNEPPSLQEPSIRPTSADKFTFKTCFPVLCIWVLWMRTSSEPEPEWCEAETAPLVDDKCSVSQRTSKIFLLLFHHLYLTHAHWDTHIYIYTYSILICSKTALFRSNMAPSCSTSFRLVLAQIAFARNDGVIFSSCTSYPVNTELGSGIRNVPRECFLESAEASPNLLLCPVELFLPISSFALHFSSSPLYACPSLPFCDSPSFPLQFTGGDRTDWLLTQAKT